MMNIVLVILEQNLVSRSLGRLARAQIFDLRRTHDNKQIQVSTKTICPSYLRNLDEFLEVLVGNLAVPKVDPTRYLSISRAFLLATSDKSREVIAFCIKEHCNGEGITIRIVLNTRNLLVIIREFITLAKILQ
jgi:hypothetical protein